MKTALLLLTIACGILFPYGHSYAFLIKYLLILLLLFAFLEIKIDKSIIRMSHFLILGVNIAFPIVVFFVVSQFDYSVAQAAFIAALTPTAIASPVITSLLKGKVEYVAFSLLLTNFTIALLVPFLLPALLNTDSQISAGVILVPVITVFSIPLVIAQFIKYVLPKLHSFLTKYKNDSFYILIVAIYLGTSKASYYVTDEMNSPMIIVVYIAIASMIICFTNFSLGKLIGGKNLKQEGGQSLGQKNNAFTIWLALTFVSPLAVLGPVFYILFQNFYISWQLYRAK